MFSSWSQLHLSTLYNQPTGRHITPRHRRRACVFIQKGICLCCAVQETTAEYWTGAKKWWHTSPIPLFSHHRADAAEGHAIDRQVCEGPVQHDGRKEAVPLSLLSDRWGHLRRAKQRTHVGEPVSVGRAKQGV